MNRQEKQAMLFMVIVIMVVFTAWCGQITKAAAEDWIREMDFCHCRE